QLCCRVAIHGTRICRSPTRRPRFTTSFLSWSFQMKAALVFLTFLFSQVATPNRIADVQIRGSRRIPTETIKFNIQTKVGDTLNRDIIRRDVKTLYALSYFDDVRVDEEESPSGLIIMFVVKEKPIVRSIDYKGLNSITKSEVLEKFKEKKVGLS